MSYDLSVFSPTAAPRTREAFLAWFSEQGDLEGYDNPQIAVLPLRSWFHEMIRTFPPMNGPFARADVADLGDPTVTDYSLGPAVITACFGWSQMEEGHNHAMDLAAKHGVGLFASSLSEDDIWLPTPDGNLVRMPEFE